MFADHHFGAHSLELESPIGLITLIGTASGLARVLIGSADERDGRPIGSTLNHYHKRNVVQVLDNVAQRIVLHLVGTPQTFEDVVLDLRGVSPFTRNVYQTLQSRVPAGSTVSYGHLAVMCGRPLAARAIGRAMAMNPVPIVIPCHRVVGADGRLTGFSAGGGVNTKAMILEIEAKSYAGRGLTVS